MHLALALALATGVASHAAAAPAAAPAAPRGPVPTVAQAAPPVAARGPVPTVAQAAPPAAPAAPAVPKAWLGITVVDVAPGVPGVEVKRVVPGSPAQRAGLEASDVILLARGRLVTDADTLAAVLAELSPGSPLVLRVKRAGSERDVSVQVGKAPDATAYARRELPLAPKAELTYEGLQERGCLGITCLDLPEQLGAYFGAPAGRGVLVESVEAGSPAAGAGLRAGDVILSLDGKAVASVTELAEALRAREPGVRVSVTLLRDGARRDAAVTLRACQIPVWSVGEP